MIIVADSSPLISFAIIRKLDILSKIFTDIYIPQAVYDEITLWNKPSSKALNEFSKSRVQIVQNRLAVNVLRNDLDLGEAETIVLALEHNIENVLIDEHKGRRIARSHGLFPIGTIGVLIQAKHEKLIRTIKPCLEELVKNKIRISKALYQKALEMAGEK